MSLPVKSSRSGKSASAGAMKKKERVIKYGSAQLGYSTGRTKLIAKNIDKIAKGEPVSNAF